MSTYQVHPLSIKTRVFLRKVLPESIYLKYFGRHEKMSLRLWQHIASKAPTELAILDIGAFHGEFAVSARKVNKTSEIFAFEPNPESLQILKPICKNNRVSIVENALSNENKELYSHCDVQKSQIVKDDSDSNTITVNT